MVVLEEGSATRRTGTDGHAFRGFARRTLLEAGDVPIEQLAHLALREGQSTSPLHRVHRWFARRLGSQFRGMLAALSLPEDAGPEFWDRYFGRIPLDEAIVLDPFAGGGTAVVEASRCGAHPIGFDVDPVAAFIARFELAASTHGGITEAARNLCWETSAQISPLHTTKVAGQVRQVLHHFWVELRACSSCQHEFEIHPHYRLAYDKEKGRQWSFCRGCHKVQELPLKRKELRCDCGLRTRIDIGTLNRGGKVTCPCCRSTSDLASRGESGTGDPEALRPPRWRLFAQEYLEPQNRLNSRAGSKGFRRRFKTATEEDRGLYDRAGDGLQQLENSMGPFVPDREIPVHPRSDRRPLLHGFGRYRDLFNDRQLLHLSVLGRTISSLKNEADKELLGLAFSEHLTTNCMYASYAFGYRRISPLFSMHAYRHIVRPVELNPWLEGLGRGTFPNALNKVEKGVSFARTPTDLHPDGGRAPGGGPVGPPDGRVGRSAGEVVSGKIDAVIRVQDSTDLSSLPDGCVDLVLTDPPYFDNVCYSELSDFYLAWHQALGLAEPPYDDPTRSAPTGVSLAATDRSEAAVRAYTDGLQAIFAGCARVLRPDGICVFTYHHGSPTAWLSLGKALAASGLSCSSVLPLRGEGQGGLHSYEGTIKWDAVLVCRKASRKTGRQTSEAPDVERGSVVVPRETPRTAAAEARAYARRLSGQEELGFGEPDRINLYRAFVASESRIGEPGEDWIPLHDALVAGRPQTQEIRKW